MAVQPFKIDIPESTLTDLRERLARTRWPDEIPGSEWDYGSNLDYIKELTEYWRTDYDWRAQEAAPQLLLPIQDQRRRPGHPLHPPARARAPTPCPSSSPTAGPAPSSR